MKMSNQHLKFIYHYNDLCEDLEKGRICVRRRQWQPTPVLLPGEFQGRGSQVGCHLWGCTESDTTEATQHQQQKLLFLFLTIITVIYLGSFRMILQENVFTFSKYLLSTFYVSGIFSRCLGMLQ